MAEDEAIRAVRAGVAMQDTFREFVRTREEDPERAVPHLDRAAPRL